MTDLHEILYQFLWEHRMPPPAPEDQAAAALEIRQRDALRSALPPDQVRQLDELVDTMEEQLCRQQRLMFQAALSLGMELFRLQGATPPGWSPSS